MLTRHVGRGTAVSNEQFKTQFEFNDAIGAGAPTPTSLFLPGDTLDDAVNNMGSPTL